MIAEALEAEWPGEGRTIAEFVREEQRKKAATYLSPTEYAMEHASRELYVTIVGHFDDDEIAPGQWWISEGEEVRLGENILVPDFAGWRRKRMPALPDTTYYALAPDWVCEVLSDSTRRLDLDGERAVYAREGVGHLWLVDTTARTLDAYELREAEWVLIANAKDDDPISIRPFDAITFNLGEFWP